MRLQLAEHSHSKCKETDSEYSLSLLQPTTDRVLLGSVKKEQGSLYGSFYPSIFWLIVNVPRMPPAMNFGIWVHLRTGLTGHAAGLEEGRAEQRRG